MKRNSAPRIVGSTRSWGVRRYCSVVRRAVSRVAIGNVAPVGGERRGGAFSEVMGGTAVVVIVGLRRSGGVGRGVERLVGRVAGRLGERQEHLVERRTSQADVVDGDGALLEHAKHGRHLFRALVD